MVAAVVDFDMCPAVYTHLLVQLEKREGFISVNAAGPKNPAQTSAISQADGYIWIKNLEAGLCRGQTAEVFVF